MKKKLFFAFSMILFFSFTTFAQDAPANNQVKKSGLENRVDKMAADLGLNNSEKASVKTLFVKQAEDMKKFRTDNPDKESPDFKAKQKELRTAQDAELVAVIGDAKFRKLKEIRAAEKKMKGQKTE